MADRRGSLDAYQAKRDFTRTREPPGEIGPGATGALRFVVQKHAARRLHYDFRLEWGGVLLSWAVTKGPSADPREKRLAVRTEDHPLSYGSFEGTIPKGQYGGGTVMLWDEGTWLPEGDVAEGLAGGKFAFHLAGTRMRGRWALVRMRGREKRENWLLIKERDADAEDVPDRLTQAHQVSVTTARTMEEIAAGAEPRAVPPPRAARQGGKRPGFRAPQLATLVADAPAGEGWIHETKFDGYRCLASLGAGGVRLWTRNGHDWTDRFAPLVPAFAAVDCAAALIDGEVLARDGVGGSAFSALQAALANGAPLVFVAFDLLSLDGADLTRDGQLIRRARLEALFAGLRPDGPLRMSAHVVGGGPRIFAAACKAGAEGIISKRADAPYRGGRTKAWVKVKCTRRREFVIGGVSPSDKPGRPFASLLLGETGPGGLRYRGRVGTGFGERDFEMLTAKMRSRATSPFGAVPAEFARHARWVEPVLVAEVDFSELTDEGHIRHGRYLGLREDKAAAEVTRADHEPAQEPRGGRERETGKMRVAGISISHPDREIFPDAGCTKVDLARYVARAGARLTAVAGHRPLSLLRCPTGIDGERFFQKHAGPGFPKELSRIEIAERGGGREPYLYATRQEAFVAAVQIGTIEFHIWGARVDRLERPERLVFDLDPDEGLAWADVRAAAFDLRDRLADLGLASVPVVTGGKGVHVCVLLRRTRSWETVRLFAKTLAHVMTEADPARFTAVMAKKQRVGRIFIDWLRNEQGATAIAPWSVRARAGAPVAVPVTWEELCALDSAAAFTLSSIDERLARDCPYLAAMGALQSLTEATIGRLVTS